MNSCPSCKSKLNFYAISKSIFNKETCIKCPKCDVELIIKSNRFEKLIHVGILMCVILLASYVCGALYEDYGFAFAYVFSVLLAITIEILGFIVTNILIGFKIRD